MDRRYRSRPNLAASASLITSQILFWSRLLQERVPGIRAPEACHRGYYVKAAREEGVSCLVRSKPDDDDDLVDDAVTVVKAAEACATARSARVRGRMRRKAVRDDDCVWLGLPPRLQSGMARPTLSETKQVLDAAWG